MGEATATGLQGRIETLLAARTDANLRFFAAEADRLARCCHRMAERFARGGRLIAFGVSPAARSDVRHVTVEFVHPVIVGKRALPALGLTPEAGPIDRAFATLAVPEDIAIGFEAAPETVATLAAARERGCLTIGFGADAEFRFDPPGEDRFIAQELAELVYHLLWELGHVFFEHRGLLQARDARPVHDAGASQF